MPTQELDYISIQGFKSIRSIRKLALNPINIVVGANGSGKSNFIGAFMFLHEIHAGRLNDYVRTTGGAERLLHFGSKVTPSIRMEVSFRRHADNYSLNLISTQDDMLAPIDEPDYGSDKDRALRRQARSHGPRQDLDRWRLYHVHDTSATSPLRKTAKTHDNDFLRADGANLPAFLYLLQEKYPDAYSLIRRTVRKVAPFFDDFVLRPDALNEEFIRLAWRHKNSDQYFNAAALSDGTLRFIALATLFLQPAALRPSVILVDEPELGLHPYAIAILAALIKQTSAQGQVILSTQSPLLLDHFAPEDVLVAERREGGTDIHRLESDALADWLDDYSLGQLWEKNEFGGRPGEG
ncbi:MAG TPA: AAA family ATPase [Rhodocyclaceae bacterium]|nr:AAA family ATPase [Rhodocyclaceae bacterium]